MRAVAILAAFFLPGVYAAGDICECVDKFVSEPTGDYKISNQYFESCGGVDVMSRRVKTSGSWYTEATLIVMGASSLEVFGTEYFVDGAPVGAAPASLDGNAITLSSSPPKDFLTIDCGGGDSIVVTTTTGIATSFISVSEN